MMAFLVFIFGFKGRRDERKAPSLARSKERQEKACFALSLEGKKISPF